MATRGRKPKAVTAAQNVPMPSVNPFTGQPVAASGQDATNTVVGPTNSSANGPQNAGTLPSLLQALKFIKFAQAEIGPLYNRHCVLYDGWAYAHDGTLSAGIRVAEHVQLAPHTEKLLAALERSGDALALTQVAGGLQVRSGKLRAVVPCLDLGSVPPIYADPPVAPLGASFLDALRATAPLASDGAATVALAGIRLAAGTATATDRAVVIEYWHGYDMPTVLMPKLAAKELLRIGKTLVAFGVSPNLSSITFHFEDQSWMKTQLYDANGFPSIDSIERIMAKPCSPRPIPNGFFDAINMIAPFVDEKYRVFFVGAGLATDPDSHGTTVEIAGLPHGAAFDVRKIKLLEKIAKSIDFGVTLTPNNNNPLMFYGDNVRGAVAPLAYREKPDETRPADPTAGMPDDIPF